VLAPRECELILDAGCGTGRNLGKLLEAGSLPIGIDFSQGMLEVARDKHSDIPLLLCDLERTLPFAAETFDAVLCALIGEHLSALKFVFDEFYRVLAPGGRLVFSVYHPAMSAAGIEANFEREGTEYRLGAFHYTVEEHLNLFAKAGLSDVTASEFVGDEALAGLIPSAKKYLGFPLLLILMGHK
jgi:SAM-dependent methyltransferase